MKSGSLALLAIGVLAPGVDRVAPSRSAAPIAYVSLQRLSTESIDAKAAAKRLEALRQTKAQDVNAKKQALDATRLQLANAGGVLQSGTRARLRAEENRQQTELQRATQQAQTEFQDLQRQLQGDLRRELSAVVGEIAKRRAIQIVLNADS